MSRARAPRLLQNFPIISSLYLVVFPETQMSGVEVAGLVLGAIPLVIAALENYANGVSAIHKLLKYEVQIKEMLTRLRTEYHIYQNTSEKLLNGLVSSTDMKKLLLDPGGEPWRSKELNTMLRDRLQGSFDVYMSNIEMMNDALLRMRQRLDLKDNGEVKYDKNALERAYKKSRFTLRFRDHESSLARLRDYNANLCTLTEQNIELEPSRKYRAQPTVHSKLQKYAQSLYNALQSSLGCSCKPWHFAMLDLFMQPSTAPLSRSIPKDNTEFRVVLSWHTDGKEPTDLSSPSSPAGWQELTIAPLESLIPDAKQTTPVLPTLDVQGKCADGKSKSRPRKSVRWGSSPSEVTVSTSISVTTLTAVRTIETSQIDASVISADMSIQKEPQSVLSEQVSSICRMITSYKSNKTPVSASSIADGGTKFSISLGAFSDKDKDEWTFITLRNILSRNVRGMPLITTCDKMKMSAQISSAALALQSSAWLGDYWSKDEIRFLQRSGSDLYSRVFVSKSLSSEPVAAKQPALSIIANRPLFELGIMLIEVCLGQHIEELATDEELSETGGKHSYLTSLLVADRLLTTQVILKNAGPQCHAAIKACIDLSYGHGAVKQLQDHTVQSDLYTKVAAVFQEMADGCDTWLM